MFCWEHRQGYCAIFPPFCLLNFLPHPVMASSLAGNWSVTLSEEAVLLEWHPSGAAEFSAPCGSVSRKHSAVCLTNGRHPHQELGCANKCVHQQSRWGTAVFCLPDDIWLFPCCVEDASVFWIPKVSFPFIFFSPSLIQKSESTTYQKSFIRALTTPFPSLKVLADSPTIKAIAV